MARSVALSRCLEGVFSLNRAPCDLILNIAEECIESSPLSTSAGLPAVRVEVHLYVTGEHWLNETINYYADRIHLHHVNIDDPLQLPLVAAQSLWNYSAPADMNLYLEDDLVIHDPLYVDKQAWFQHRTGNRFVLMPHRFEPTVANAPRKFFVDGPIKEDSCCESVWTSDEKIAATGRFWDGQDLSFSLAPNPHSGSFCVSSHQLEQMRSAPWPPEVFIGPLETAATGIVMAHFQVLKPSWSCRNFLLVEHANPSFRGLLGKLPYRNPKENTLF